MPHDKILVFAINHFKHYTFLLTHFLLHGEKQYEEFGRFLSEVITNLYI